MQRADAARGLLAPSWSLDLTARPNAQAAQPAGGDVEHQSARQACRGQGAHRRLWARVTTIVDQGLSALDRQIALMKLKPTRNPATASSSVACRTATQSCDGAEPGHHDDELTRSTASAWRQVAEDHRLDTILKSLRLFDRHRRRNGSPS
jgi:hypothetical protein